MWRHQKAYDNKKWERGVSVVCEYSQTSEYSIGTQIHLQLDSTVHEPGISTNLESITKFNITLLHVKTPETRITVRYVN